MHANSAYDSNGSARIYVLLENGQRCVYEEQEVHAMLERRALPREAYFWKAGMEGWRPLSELPPPMGHAIAPPRRAGKRVSSEEPQATPIPSETDQKEPPDFDPIDAQKPRAQTTARPVARMRGPVRTPRFRTNPIPLTVFLQLLIVISITAASFFIYECLNKIYGWGGSSASNTALRILEGTAAADTSAVGLSSSNISFLFHLFWALAGVHLLVEVLFFCWIYYANKNCRGFVGHLRFTPGWSVGCFFVPIINLFRPYQVMQEIWKVSDNPRTAFLKNDSIFVGIWFFCRLVILVLSPGPFHTAYNDSDEPGIRAMGTFIYLLTLEANILLVELTTLILVSVVTWRQVSWVRQKYY